MNTNNRNAVAGYFTDQANAQRAVSALQQARFTENEYDIAPYRGASAGSYAGTTPFMDNTNTSLGSSFGFNNNGGMLITVHGSRTEEARRIMEQSGGDISDRVNPALAEEGVQRIQLREEQLQARKQNVQAGEVLIRKDVITENRSIDVPLTHDEVVIERHPVTDRRVSDTPIGQDTADIRVPLMREEATLEKQAIVREEVEIGKRSVTSTEHLSGTVRREEARIDNTGDVHVEGQTDHRDEMLEEDQTGNSSRTNR